MNKMSYKSAGGKIYKYGEFFPPELSPFPYNITVAQEFFPLARDAAESRSYRWKDIERKKYSTANNIVQCQNHDKSLPHCPGAFKITQQELQYYNMMKIPSPQYCPNCRYMERIKQRNPISLWHRKCMKPGCVNEFETSYAPDRSEIVYCESCYQEEIY